MWQETWTDYVTEKRDPDGQRRLCVYLLGLSYGACATGDDFFLVAAR